MAELAEILDESKLSKKVRNWIIIALVGVVGYFVWDKLTNDSSAKTDSLQKQFNNYKIATGIKNNSYDLIIKSLVDNINYNRDYSDQRLDGHIIIEDKKLKFIVDNTPSSKQELIQTMLDFTKDNIIEIVKANIVVKNLPEGMDKLVETKKPKGDDTVYITKEVIKKDTIKKVGIGKKILNLFKNK